MHMSEEQPSKSQATWKDFILMCMYGPLVLLQVVLAVKFFSYLGSTLALIGGGIFFFLFLVVGALPRYEFKKLGEVVEGRSYIHTTTVVDSGIYAIIRHPQFLSWILLSIALALLSQHWLSAVCVVPVAVLIYLEALREDKSNIEKFGDNYSKYMQSVPRLNPLVGIVRRMQ